MMSKALRRESSCWRYFDKIDTNSAKCRLCRKILRTNGNTSNMQSHLRVHIKMQKESKVLGVPKSAMTSFLADDDMNGPWTNMDKTNIKIESVSSEADEFHSTFADALPNTTAISHLAVSPTVQKPTETNCLEAKNEKFGEYAAMILNNISDAAIVAHTKLQIKVLLSKAIMEDAESLLLKEKPLEQE